jgi:hypothetical protein
MKSIHTNLSEVRAEQHVNDLLADAERDRRRGASRETEHWWPLTTSRIRPLRSGSVDRHGRVPGPPRRTATCGDSAAIDSDRLSVAKFG